jgi:hypothetical protein
MNLLRFAIIVPLTLVLGAAIAGCSDDDGGISGSGNIVTRDFELSGFTSVRLDLFSAEITQSDTYSVTVRVDDNILDLIDVDTAGETLVLTHSGAGFKGNVTLEATITMPTIESLELNGAASADLDGFDSLDAIEIDLNGASDLTGVLTADRVQIDVSGASKVTGEFAADRVEIDANGASRVTLEGSATSVTLNASGASKVDLADFTAATGEVELSGASEATVNITDSIDRVNVRGASKLRYKGDPTLGDVSTAGASSVDQVD